MVLKADKYKLGGMDKDIFTYAAKYMALMLFFIFPMAEAISASLSDHSSEEFSSPNLRFVAEDLPPFHFINKENELDGFLVEVVQALLIQAKLTGTIELVPFARAYNATKIVENTFMFSLLKTPVRNNKFKWVGQSYKTQAFLVGLKNRQDIELNSLNDAKALNVGTIRGYYSESFLKGAGFKEKQNLSLSVKYEHMWNMLFKRRIDLVLTNFIALDREITSIGLDATKISPYLEVKNFPGELYIATGIKTSDKRVSQLRVALAKIKKNGHYQEILDKWQL